MTLCARDSNTVLSPRWSKYPFPSSPSRRLSMFLINWLWDVLAQLGMLSSTNIGGRLDIRFRFVAQER